MSDSFLSQEEVDALLEGVTGESQKSVEEVAEAGAVRNYDCLLYTSPSPRDS